MTALEQLLWSGADTRDLGAADLRRLVAENIGGDQTAPHLEDLALHLVRRDIETALGFVNAQEQVLVAESASNAHFWAHYLRAIALILAFVRDQWTGPPLPATWPLRVTRSTKEPERDTLAVDGEDWLAACAPACALLEATRCLAELDWTSAYQAWWYVRALWLYQQCLSGPSALLRDQILSIGKAIALSNTIEVQVVVPPFSRPRYRMQQVTASWTFDGTLAETFLSSMEFSLMNHYYSFGEVAREFLEHAASRIGARICFSGERGIRLRYQKRPMALLRVRIDRSSSISTTSHDGTPAPDTHPVSGGRRCAEHATGHCGTHGNEDAVPPETATRVDRRETDCQNKEKHDDASSLDLSGATSRGATLECCGKTAEARSFGSEPRLESASKASCAVPSSQAVMIPDSSCRAVLPASAHDHQGTDAPPETESAAVVVRDAHSSPYAAGMPRAIPLRDDEYLGHTVCIESVGSEQVSPHPLSVTDCILLSGLVAIDASQQVTTALSKENIRSCVEYIIEATERSTEAQAEHALLRAYALLVRTRLELDRARFQERVMEQMEELVERFYNDTQPRPELTKHLWYAFATAYPLRWQMQREWAGMLGRLGLVKSALDVFQSLEMWEHAVDCHRLMGNWTRAYQMLIELLRVRDRSPRLLCVLGDVLVMMPERDRPLDEHRTPEALYNQAWQISGERYARAQRSLGRLAMRRGDWQRAYEHFRRALTVNPLHQDIWFACGFCAQKLGRWDWASESYTSAVQYEPEHAEAWSNLGHALLRQTMAEEAGNPASMLKRHRVVKCFAEAARLRPESWQVWQNLLIAATGAKEWALALRAQSKLLEFRGRDGYDHAALAAILAAMSDVLDETSVTDQDVHVDDPVRVRQMSALESLLRSVAATGISDPIVWDALRRCATRHGNLAEALEYSRKTIRALETAARPSQFGSKKMASAGAGLQQTAPQPPQQFTLAEAYLALAETLMLVRQQRSSSHDRELENDDLLLRTIPDRSAASQVRLFLERYHIHDETNKVCIERLREIAKQLGILSGSDFVSTSQANGETQ